MLLYISTKKYFVNHPKTDERKPTNWTVSYELTLLQLTLKVRVSL